MIRVPSIRAGSFRAAAVLLPLAFAVSACGSATPATASPASGSLGSSAGTAAQTPGMSAGQSPSSSPIGSVPTGNDVILPVPSDAPPALASETSTGSCGAIISFEVDPDVSPPPTPPASVTPTDANDAALACLVGAWQAHRAAWLVTDEMTDEQDRIYTVYRLPGDGSVDVLVRLDSHTEKTVTWTETTCRDLTLQDGRPTPRDCESEQIIR